MRTYNSVLHVARHEITLVSSVGCPSRGSPVPTRGTAGHRLRFQLFSKVMRVGSDTFGDPLIQKILQNEPSSQIMGILRFFA